MAMTFQFLCPEMDGVCEERRERRGGNRWEDDGGLKAVKECEGRTAKMERTCTIETKKGREV
jgi:hypothetical protein